MVVESSCVSAVVDSRRTVGDTVNDHKRAAKDLSTSCVNCVTRGVEDGETAMAPLRSIGEQDGGEGVCVRYRPVTEVYAVSKVREDERGCSQSRTGLSRGLVEGTGSSTEGRYRF